MRDLFSDLFESHNSLGDMTEEDREKFQNSQEYKDYSATVHETTEKQANMYGKSVEEVMGLTSMRERLGYSFNSIKCYQVDIEDYMDFVDQSPVMQQTLEEGKQILPTFEYLYQDIYMSLAKYRLELVPEDEMYTSTRLNRGILKNLINTPEYISLRQHCRMDKFNAAIGTEIIAREAMEILREAIDQIKDLQKQKDALDDLIKKEEEIDDLVRENEDLDELIQDMQQDGNAAGAAQLAAQRDANEQSIKQAKAIANKIAEECDDLVDEESDEVVQITRQMGTVLDTASEEVQEVSQMVDAWGLGGGSQCKVAFQNKKEAIEKIRRSEKLSAFTDMIGRFKESAITEQKKKAKHGAVEIKSVTLGDKIQDTLPSERMLLCNDTTKPDFYRKMTEKQLMTYSKEAHKQKNKGPIICCVDTSGSMEGDNEVWSKAMTVALMEVAQMQKRDFACIIYDSDANAPIIIKKDEVAPQKIIDVAETFNGGGTNFEAPLREALKLLEDSTFKEGDIVFISDGDCGISDSFLKKYKHVKEEKEFKTQGIIINLGRWGHSSDSTLNEFCDKVTRISDLADLKDSESELNKTIFSSI